VTAVRRLPAVDQEVIEAVDYYRAIDFQLGARLVQEFEDAVQRIVHFPEGWKEIGIGLRRCGLKKFPFVVIYRYRDDEIIIIAFANTHRRPDYWRDRVKSQ
jgi:plasmid stabilization system protein ParE